MSKTFTIYIVLPRVQIRDGDISRMWFM